MILTKPSPVITYGEGRERRKEPKRVRGWGGAGQSRARGEDLKCCDLESRVVTTLVQIQIAW